MGYLSCRADSSVVTCDSYKKEKKKKKPLKIQQFHYKDLEIATNGFSPDTLLGKGSHGCVYKGILHGGKLVAIKRASSGLRTLHDDTALENEIEILSKIQNPRLVNLLGFSHDSNQRILVVEFMCNGTLHDVLHRRARSPNWARRVRLALQTAKALETLHSSNPPVIHRDVKSSNVLIDSNWNARLGDFGLALRGHVEDIRLKSTPPAGTIGYLDPGYLTPENLSTKNDVFSFGILLLEIISGRNAIDVNHSPPSIVDWAIPLIRKGKLISLYDPRIGPLPDLSARKQFALIAARCVRSCRERRPSMREVVEGLKLVSKSIPFPVWTNIRRIGLPNANPCSSVDVERERGVVAERRQGRRTIVPDGWQREVVSEERGIPMDFGTSGRVSCLTLEVEREKGVVGAEPTQGRRTITPDGKEGERPKDWGLLARGSLWSNTRASDEDSSLCTESSGVVRRSRSRNLMDLIVEAETDGESIPLDWMGFTKIGNSSNGDLASFKLRSGRSMSRSKTQSGSHERDKEDGTVQLVRNPSLGGFRMQRPIMVLTTNSKHRNSIRASNPV
ncbi:hypothetical protein AMTRI_Chr01g128890 [Amborella trichopoda]